MLAHPINATEFEAVCPTLPCKDLSAYRVESRLGGGGFSHVVLAREAHPVDAASGDKDWALKLIPATDAQCLADVDRAPLILTEARIHLLMSSEPSVLPCVEAFKSVFADEMGNGGARGGDAGRATYMAVLRMPVAACSVEEWLFSAAPAAPAACQNMSGGPRGGHVDETEVLTVWVQMVNAVHRCHAHGVVHHDVKLPNFLMDARGKVQIMDFGLACVEGVTPRAIAGTPWTMSPAGFKHGDDGRAGDWWSLGVVLYQLLQGGCWPFKSCWWPWQKGGGQRMEDAIRKAVLSGRISWHRNGGAGVSEGCKALIRGLLQPDPNRRWQLRQVLACEVVTPEMLTGVGARFPELQQDMQALLALQRRARGVKALGSDGGAAAATAAGAMPHPSIAHMAAGVKAGAASLLAAAAAAASHAPHWPGGAGGRHLPDGGSYQPLLSDGSSAAGTMSPATASFMGAASATRPAPQTATPAQRQAANVQPQQQQQRQQQQQQQQQQQPQKPAHVDDLLLLFGDVPNAHPSPPPTPPSASRAQAFPGDELGRTSNKPPHPSRHGSQGSAALRHACTTGSLADAAAADPAASSPSGAHHRHHASSLDPPSDAGGAPLDSAAAGGVSGSALSGASLSPSGRLSHPALGGGGGDGGGGGGGGGSAAQLPLRGSRTSLQDLFGPHSHVPMGPRHNILERLSSHHPASGAAAGAGAHGPPAHQHQQRVLSGGALGGLLGSAADLFGGLGGGVAGRPTPRRRSWGPLAEPLTVDVGGGGGSLPGAAAGSHELLHSPSSWVPPPPEAFHRVSAGSRRRSDAGSAAGGGGGGSGSPGLRHGGPPRSRSFVARAKALFTDCLPGKKSSMVLYDVYEEVGEEEEYAGLQS
ncbi:hypothetical protein HXX76_001580 [Chlamydomonas incerta]|uniref:Protein kinase domain-containing protein n=1 Tax=Chlamydomonas incerta TaxID=51695 RepID=A0A835WCC9_CHLIN|nr:hypothetical protein HXX76_001580 [Chlamydomonas incerta]|eukprot:KAG2444839.1 hypothetical protein HXX76_001580 [Chlamydomonas incerta]